MSDELERATKRRGDRDGARGPRLMIVSDRGVIIRPLPAAGALVIGRGADADLRIDDESMSRKHARVTIDSGGVTIEDLGSANGTRLAHARIPAGTATPVPPGVTIELGDVLMVFRRDDPDAVAPAPQTSDGRLIERVARSQVNVLIVGETGSGKERMAERLHSASRRAAGPLVRVNCAALTESLAESELFGHEKGAFTGAGATRIGLIEAASGGTLVLDEVGELSPAVQAKLLRVLEQREVVRVGAVQPIAVDVRFVAATHRDLPRMVADGQFRQDLYFRLDGFTLRVPPLRERRAELPALASELLVEACRREAVEPAPALSAEALAALASHDWPGNVRELRNALDRAVLRWTGGPLTAAHLGLSAAPAAAAPVLRDGVDGYEKQRILEALERHGGNQTAAAKQLGISRRTMVARLQAWGLTRSRKG